jgi:hypothetical protein
MARKILACKKGLEKFKHVVRKFKWSEKTIFGKIKYEINTILPLARARHFYSDGWDFSLAWFILLT